jgi:hypothetical protein
LGGKEFANCGECACVNGVSPYPRWTIEGVMQDSRECPRRAMDPEAGYWLDLYSHYQNGHLYRSGGIEKQPALYMRVMRLVDGVVKESRESHVP